MLAGLKNRVEAFLELIGCLEEQTRGTAGSLPVDYLASEQQVMDRIAVMERGLYQSGLASVTLRYHQELWMSGERRGVTVRQRLDYAPS